MPSLLPRLTVFLLLLTAAARAQSPAVVVADTASFTMEVPFDGTSALPSWMGGLPMAAPGDRARLTYLLTPPPGRDLLLHIVFDDSGVADLRVEWWREGESVPDVVAADLAEGTGLHHQRALLIPAARLAGPGLLTLQAGTSRINARRIRFEWVSPVSVSAVGEAVTPAAVDSTGRALTAADLAPGPRPVPADEWRGGVVRAALTASAEPLAPALEIEFPLEKVPQLARMEAEFAGVLLDQEVWLIANNQEVGPFSLEVPSLNDPGYLAGNGQAPIYAGWRRAAIHLPISMLQAGDNVLRLELRSPEGAGHRNKARVRDAVLELLFPASGLRVDFALPVPEVPPDPPSGSLLPPPPAFVAPVVSIPPAPESGEPATPGDALQRFWQGL